METDRLPSYPEHPEPTSGGGDYDREEKPRMSAWAQVFGGSVLLLIMLGIGYLLFLLTRPKTPLGL
jgi:hypothetical protein